MRVKKGEMWVRELFKNEGIKKKKIKQKSNENKTKQIEHLILTLLLVLDFFYYICKYN